MELQAYEKEHLVLVQSTAADCTLFLKKDGKYPLNAPCTIAAFGNGIRHTIKGGTGSGEVNSRFDVNIEEGLKNVGFDITSTAWLDAFDGLMKENHKAFVEEIKAQAKAENKDPLVFAMGKVEPLFEHELELKAEGDAAIYVLSRNSGEGNDRKVEAGDVLLTKSEIRDILALNSQFDKFMLVLNVGGPVDLTPVMDVGNILLLSQLGVVTGTVLADILLGKANPSGKLTTTWTSASDYSDIGNFGDFDDNYYKEGIYIGYRYFDVIGKKALFPFGFGLSYSQFDMDNISLEADGELISVEAQVKNISQTRGKEVMQVYVSAPAGRLDKPYKQLVAFAKSGAVEAGESETIRAFFSLSDVASYDESTASYILEAGDYVVRVGYSSDKAEPVAIIRLSDTVTLLQCRNCLGEAGFEDYKPQALSEKLAEKLPIFELSKGDFSYKDLVYDVDYPVEDAVEAFSDEDLALALTGAFTTRAEDVSVIGNASFSVAGAAGETTKLLTDKGLKSLVMADGPAGLRLSKQYYEDENGAHAYNKGVSLESMVEFYEPEVLAKLQENAPAIPEGVEIKYQYATAIPIGTAIAQSFDYDLAKAYGDMVGSEMERFGIQLWLAPALNIHRSILCGRNFEYYSEDPVVAGLMAAAITEGVQAHPGCATTIKHYAANNAETNRYNNNSHVSERAMREIYLRGFGICVKKAQPHALMTSYNLLNGTHTAEHRGLIEDILRCEYGYKGIVMTDWVLAIMSSPDYKYRGTHSDKVAIAGGDLFMPGCKEDYERTLSAIKDGSLSRKHAKQNVSRLYRMADFLNK